MKQLSGLHWQFLGCAVAAGSVESGCDEVALRYVLTSGKEQDYSSDSTLK